MYIFHTPEVPSFQKVGIEGRIFAAQEAYKDGQFVHISTEKGHETVIQYKSITMTYYILSGEGIFTIGGEDYDVNKNNLVIIPPNLAYTYTGKMELLLLTTPIYDASDEEQVGENPKWKGFEPQKEKSEQERLQESLARSQADYQNLLMRVDRDKADMVSFLAGKILLPLLTQVDNLERAVKLKEGVEGDGFIDGVRSVLTSMGKYLESQGVKPFVSLGEEVDPSKHDVMTQAPGPEGKIVSEFEKGYTIGDRVLRHAKVVVGSGV